MKALAAFFTEEQGQDLVEYTLLLAFVMITSVALYINAGGSVTGIWGTANSALNKGEQAAS